MILRLDFFISDRPTNITKRFFDEELLVATNASAINRVLCGINGLNIEMLC